VLGFLERLEHPYSILTGAVDAGSSVSSGDASGEGSKADVVSGRSRRRSGPLIGNGFSKIVSPPCDSSTIGAVPGGVPGTLTSSSSPSSTGLGTVGLDTSWSWRRPPGLKAARARHCQRPLPHLLLAGVGVVGIAGRRQE
jgi:hypothetical protein